MSTPPLDDPERGCHHQLFARRSLISLHKALVARVSEGRCLRGLQPTLLKSRNLNQKISELLGSNCPSDLGHPGIHLLTAQSFPPPFTRALGGERSIMAGSSALLFIPHDR